MKEIDVYIEEVPEYYIGNPSITIQCKKSEVDQIGYDIRCVLIDSVNKHKQFNDVKIIDHKFYD
jgi:hypothetical protein